MKHHIEVFIRKYLKAINDNNAAIFAGAGLSIPAGYVNWKELLRDVAEELKLQVDQEDDLIALAQYYVNEKGGRGAINQKLLEEFTKGAKPTPNLQILSKLPIKHFWTTNYDKLIEQALDAANKSVDLKITSENLANSLPRRDAIVYKMHGDISLPHDAVLTKDDYENYNTKRQLFTTALQGDLVTKTFLFIGFSFDDPNLEYILSRIRVLLGENQREHFCFFKQPQIDDYLSKGIEASEAEKRMQYDRLALQYKIKDLRRYSIEALLIDDYNEITETLEVLHKKVRRKNVFISGAAHEYGSWDETEAHEFVFELAKTLAEKNYKLITGFGLGIGSSVINGALTHVFNTKYRHLEEVIIMRPFPQVTNKGVDLKKIWTDYRLSIMEEAGIAVFLFGNKLASSSVVESNGMLEEFQLAISNGVLAIPVGITGYAAEKIWKIIDAEKDRFGYDSSQLQAAFQKLNTTKSIKDLVTEITKIINLLQ